MSAEAVLEAMVQTGIKIDNLWSMYIVVHLGLFWFFFLVHRPLLFVERALALFAYGAFAFVNGNALLASYLMLEAMRRDFVTAYSAALADLPTMEASIAGASFANRGDLILITHSGAFVIVALMLIFRNSITRRYERIFPNHAPSRADVNG